MTEQTTTPIWPTTEHGNWGTPPTPPKQQAWWKKAVVILPIGAFILGSGLGAMNKPDPVTVPGPTVEKIVEVTPQSCLTALDHAEQGFTYAALIITYLNDGVQAAGKLDADGLNEASGKMALVNPKLEALVPKSKAAASECRAAAK